MFMRQVIPGLLLVLATASPSFADLLADAYNAGYTRGCRDAGGQMLRVGRCQPAARVEIPIFGGVRGLRQGMILVGLPGNEPRGPSAPYKALVSRWMFDKQFLNSPLISDTVLKAMKAGKEIQFGGKAFGVDGTMSGKGTLSFSHRGVGTATFYTDQGAEAQPWSGPHVTEKQGWIPEILLLKDDGLKHGFVIERFTVKK